MEYDDYQELNDYRYKNYIERHIQVKPFMGKDDSDLVRVINEIKGKINELV